MPKYIVTFSNTYEVEAPSETEALDIAEDNGRLLDGECFVEYAYNQEESD